MKHIKSETIVKICQLTSGVIAAIGVATVVFLVALIVGKLINPVCFIGGMVIVGLILWLDAAWIDRHFVDGEWV